MWSWLGVLQALGRLSDDQQDQVFDHLCDVIGPRLRARTPVKIGHACPVSLTAFKLPNQYQTMRTWMPSIRRSNLRLDGRRLEDHTSRWVEMFELRGTDSNTCWLVEGGGLGTHEVSCDVEFDFLAVDTRTAQGVIQKRALTLRAAFEVVPASSWVAVQPKTTDRLDKYVTESVRAEAFQLSRCWFHDAQHCVTGELFFSASRPIDLAFEVIAEVGGQQHNLGYLAVSKKEEPVAIRSDPAPICFPEPQHIWVEVQGFPLRQSITGPGVRRYVIHVASLFEKARRVDLILRASKEAFAAAARLVPDDRFEEGRAAYRILHNAGIDHYREHAPAIREWRQREGK